MGNRPATPRRGHHYATTHDVDPKFAPDRRPWSMDAIVTSDRAARPRRSPHKGPGGYFYWCLTCNTCLTGRAAFCTDHKRQYDRQVKARKRALAREQILVDKEQITRLRDLAARVGDARQTLIDALGGPDQAVHEKHLLDMSKRLITAARQLPEPPT